MTNRLSLAVAVVLACAGLALGRGPADTKKTPEEIADAALDVVSGHYPTPHDGYMVVICRAEKAAQLANDTALGPFVRYMKTAKADLAVVVVPDGYSDAATYVVYFAGGSPLGLVALDASDERASDAALAKAYTAVSGPVEKKKRQAAYKSASIPLDEGAIDVLRIVGWK